MNDVNKNKWLHRSAGVLLIALYVYNLALVLLSDDFELIWLLPILLAGHYFADLLSGVSHFVLDYTRTRPGIGLRELYFYKGDKGSEDYISKRKKVMTKVSPLEKVAFDFKTHHLSPGALARRSLLRLVLPGMYPVAYPIGLIALMILLSGWGFPEVALFILTTGFGLTICQYSHSCAHQQHPKPIPRFLQKVRLFMSAKQHNTHHMDLGVDFCILSGWANPVVNRIFNFCRRRRWIFEEGLEPI